MIIERLRTVSLAAILVAIVFSFLSIESAQAAPIDITLDETSMASQSFGSGIHSSNPEPSPGDGNFHGVLFDPQEFSLTPGVEGTDMTVYASWAVGHNHNSDVEYLLDADGSGPGAEVSLISGVSQHLYADQVTGGPGSCCNPWSNFFEIGSGLDLSAESVFRLVGSGPSSDIALTTTVWRFVGEEVPEPSTMILAILGLLGFVWRTRR